MFAILLKTSITKHEKVRVNGPSRFSPDLKGIVRGEGEGFACD